MRLTLRGAMALLACVLGVSARVHAVIKVELPVAKMVQQARAVVVGEIAAVDEARRTFRVGVTEKMKGDLTGSSKEFRLIVAEAPGADEVADLLATVKKGAPVVLFVASAGPADRSDAVLHLGDRWVRGLRVLQQGEEARIPVWKISQPYDGARSFPGRTVALVNITREIKNGGTGLQDWVSHEVCLGGVFKRADIGLKNATFLLSNDLNGDGLPDVIAGNATEARLLIARGKTFVDETANWGLAEARGTKAAAANLAGDAAIDLIIGDRIWTRTGDKFVAGPALNLGSQGQWLAMGAGDAGGDPAADVAVLLRNGRMLIAHNPGTSSGEAWKLSTATLWEDGKEALAAAFATDFADDGRLSTLVVRADSILRFSAESNPVKFDFARLTGIPLSSYSFLGPMPIQPLLLAAYDYDGLGRTDFVLVTEGGGITLANRGHGAFLINRFAHEQFRPGGRDIKLPKLPFEPSLSSTLTAPGRQVQMQPKRKRGNLLVLNDKGELWEMENERRK